MRLTRLRRARLEQERKLRSDAELERLERRWDRLLGPTNASKGVVRSLEITIGGIIERAQAETTILLHGNWSAVERVANALGKYDQRTPAELDHIIAHGQRGRR